MATDPEMTPSLDKKISDVAGVPTEAERVGTAKDTQEPIYKMMPDSKIPVSKSEGNLWKGRRDSGRIAITNVKANWKEAEAYYSLGQDVHRSSTGGERAGNAQSSRNPQRKYSSTENIVYANVNAMVPAILAKNPQAEITADLQELAPIALMYKHLVNRLASLKYAPGFNLKTKLRKCIVRCEITNEAWVMVGYTKKDQSADAARTELLRIGKELEEAKDKKEIEKLEGQLMALEETVDVLDPAGPFVRSLKGDQVLVDPTSVEDDFGDANWMMAEMMMPTKFLIAKYTKENEAGQNVSLFETQYVVTGNTDSSGSDGQDELNSFKLLKGTESFSELGYSSQESFDKAKMTKVWYCFDKVKRRFLLMSDDKWQWPLWVFDDPYQLPNFFPLYRLQYHTDPNKNRTKGEVSFYLDQQDEVNDINSEVNRMRKQILSKVLYDARYVDAAEFDKYMKGGDYQGYGVGKNLPEGMKMGDAIMSPPLPNMQFKELFDKTRIYESIDKISSTNDVLRGAQFKTNTTNDAIGTYNSIQNQRIDEKIDAIEDFSGDIFYAIMFLCAQFMTADEVKYFLGDEAADWKQMEAIDIRSKFHCTVLGGSTQKPTSAAKKDQAVKVGQILGQFANATPYVTIIMLKMFQQAFDDLDITSDDWQQIIDSIQAKLQQGAPQGAPSAGDGPSQPGDGDANAGAASPSPTADAQQGGAQAGPSTPPPPANAQEQMQLQIAIKKLPPPAQQAIANAVKEGVPQQEAFVEVVKHMQGQPAQAPQVQPQQPPTAPPVAH